MKMKKILLGTLCLIACVAGVSACKQESTPTAQPESSRSEQPVKADLSLAQTEMSLVLGERKVLFANYNVIDDTKLTFVSADEAVATVDNAGWLEACKVGETTVTVTYGDEQAVCNVRVGLGGLLPMLELEQIAEDRAFVSTQDELNLDGYVVFNNVEYTDCTLSYTVEKEEIGAVKDGIFTPKKAGETEIKVTASWRGVESTALERTVLVRVSSLVQMYINDGEQSEIVLYTRDNFGGEAYITEQPFVAEAFENGEALAVQTELVSGEDIVAFENSRVRAKKHGEAVIRVSCKDTAGATLEKDIKITVQRPLYTWEEAVEFSALDGDLPLDTLFFGEEVLLTEATQGVQTLNVRENKLTNVFYAETKPILSTVVLYTDEVGVQVDLNVYAKILRTAEDIRCLDISTDLLTLGQSVLRGYYVLANDIDATALAPNTHGGLDSKNEAGAWYFDTNLAGFAGVFDGNGHSLSINVDTLGVFGNLLPGAHVRNIALDTYVTANTAKGIATSFILSGTLHQVTVSETYISITDLRAENGAKIRYNTSLTNSLSDRLLLNNVVVELKTDTWDEALTGSVFGLGDSVRGAGSNRFVNVYCIMPSAQTPIVKTSKYLIYGENDQITSNEYTVYNYASVKRYLSYAEMARDTENSYAGFAGSYWDKTANIPIWKTEAEKHFFTVVDGAKSESVRLYTTESLGGQTFKTTAKLGMQYVTSAMEAEYSIVSGEDVVSVEGNVLTAIKGGTASVLVAYNHNGKRVEKTVEVFVTLPALRYENTVAYFSAMDGDLPLQEIFGKEVTLLSAFDEHERALTVKDNKVLGLETSATGATETVISLYSEDAGWIVPVRAYTKVIKTVDDLTVFDFSEDVIDEGVKTLTGYYILANNIGTPETPYVGNEHLGLKRKNGDNPLYNSSSYGFAGILDGNGYSIYQSATRLGLFGALTGGATIKNLALHTFAKAETLTSGLALALAEDMQKTNVQDCYFALTDERTTKSYNLILSNGSGQPALTNVVVEYKAGYNENKDGGALFNNEIMRTDGTSAEGVITATQKRYTSVYVIAPAGTPVGKISASGKTNYVYAVNETQKQTPSDSVRVWTYAGKADSKGVTVLRYATYPEMKAGNDFTAFGGAWDLSDGFPVWKTLKVGYYQTLADGQAVEGIELSINGKSSVTLGLTHLGATVQNVTYQVAEGTEFVSVNGNVLTALKEGTATVEAVVGGETVKTCTVTVVNGIIDKGAVYYSALDGKYIASDNTEKALESLVPTGETLAYVVDADGEEIQLDVFVQALYDNAKTYTQIQQITITLYTETQGYRYTLLVCTKVLNEKEDLSVFTLTGTAIKGYYLLNNDIGTAESPYDTSVQTDSGSTTVCFGGTFNGNGNAMYIEGSKGGLFGALAQGAVIENVEIHASLSASVPNGSRFVLAQGTGTAVMQNCYVTLTDNRAGATTVFSVINTPSGAFTMQNVVVEYKKGDMCRLFNVDTATRVENAGEYYTHVYIIAGEGAKATSSVYASNEQGEGLTKYATETDSVTVERYTELTTKSITGATWAIENGAFVWKI